MNITKNVFTVMHKKKNIISLHLEEILNDVPNEIWEEIYSMSFAKFKMKLKIFSIKYLQKL